MTTKRKRHTNKGLRKICGCPRRQWARCRHGWYFNFKWQGVHHRFSLDKELGRHIDSKSAAEDEAAEIRKQIKAGKFGQPLARDEMTLRQLADVYVERFVSVDHAATKPAFVWALNTICRTEIHRPTGGSEALGNWRVADIVTDSIELFREARRHRGTGPVGVNRNLGSLRALFNWALKVGYVDRTPFKRQSEPVVKLSGEHSRSRRLDMDHDEETTLLAACGAHLHAVVTAALETGMRRGEILSLQWKQIEGLRLEESSVTWAPRAEIVLPWTKTKTRRDRRIPIGTRLKAVLEMRRFDPAGQPMPADRYVFGNEIGQRIQSIKRAWHTAVLKAHGHKPTYTATANLTKDSQAALEAIDLHFHDLRREAGSRWLEGGVPLHTIRDWLGHTSIAQTSTYLAGTMRTQHDAMRQFEEHRTALQRFATNVGTDGERQPPTAKGEDRNPNKTAIGRERLSM
jgi:integrase